MQQKLLTTKHQIGLSKLEAIYNWDSKEQNYGFQSAAILTPVNKGSPSRVIDKLLSLDESH